MLVALFNNGFKSQEILKQSDPNEILKIPGFGKELVRAIFTFLMGDEFADDVLGPSPRAEEQVSEDIEFSRPQKSLDDFFGN